MAIAEVGRVDQEFAATTSRLVLYHKHGTSARTRFLCSAQESVCLPETLPRLSVLFEETERPGQESVIAHPAQLVTSLTDYYGLKSGDIELDGFRLGWVETPAAKLSIYLAHFTAIDPPFANAEAQGARFIAITEARHLSSIELELLRRAYCFVLG